MSRVWIWDSGQNMAHPRQSRPDSGLGFQIKVLKTFKVVPYSLGSGTGGETYRGRGGRASSRRTSRASRGCTPPPESLSHTVWLQKRNPEYYSDSQSRRPHTNTVTDAVVETLRQVGRAHTRTLLDGVTRKLGHTPLVWRSYACPYRPTAGSHGVMGIVLEYHFFPVGCYFDVSAPSERAISLPFLRW